jgi:cysteine desulfurase
LITTAVEHPCVLAAAAALEAAGWRVTRLGVDGQGRVAPDDVRAALATDTALISVMLANNDTGVLQPVAEIAGIARASGIPMHTDAVQAIGRMPVDALRLGADFLTLSGHKFHGPKGTGAVVCASARRPGVLLHGGSQEHGLRAGTENVPALVGMGVAARLARQRLDAAARQMGVLRERLEARLLEVAPDAVVHGAGADRLPNTLSIAFPGVRALALAMRLDMEGIAVSTTSACSTGSDAPPHVLVAMGVPPSLALASIRFSLGHDTTVAEIDEAVARIAALLPEVRRR